MTEAVVKRAKMLFPNGVRAKVRKFKLPNQPSVGVTSRLRMELFCVSKWSSPLLFGQTMSLIWRAIRFTLSKAARR